MRLPWRDDARITIQKGGTHAYKEYRGSEGDPANAGDHRYHTPWPNWKTTSRVFSSSWLATVNIPRATSTWHPIPRHQLIDTVQRALAANNLTIGTQAHSLTHDGSRYFGLMEIQISDYPKSTASTS